MKEHLRHPLLYAALALAVCWLLLLAVAPAVLEALTTREGPIEQVSHAVLLVVVGLWIVVAVRAGAAGRARRVAGLVAAYLAFLLMEEIHWGHVYDVDLGHGLLRRLIGHDSFHRLGDGGNPWIEPQLVIALPAVLFFSLPLLPRARRLARSLSPVGAEPGEAIAFFVAGAMPLAFATGALLAGADPDAPALETLGAYQLLVYLVFGAVGRRAARAR